MNRSPRPDLFPPLPDMPAELRRLIGQIPPGQVATCGQLAVALGDRQAARWVGFWLKHHRHAEDCPCHRVIYAGGIMKGCAEHSAEEQAEMLAAEGVPVEHGRVDLTRVGDGARGPGHAISKTSATPLEKLHSLQVQISQLTELARPVGRPRRIAGVDCSYGRKSGQSGEGEAWGIAALVLMDAKTRETIATHTVRHRVTFPYITSYLAFRELPAMMAVIEEAERAGDVPETILVDGAGVLHPRGAGIASMLGVVSGYPTIGVAKSHLCGSFDAEQLKSKGRAPVMWNGQTAGLAMLSRQSSPKPIFVSPGHRHSVASAAVVVRDLLGSGYTPAPIAAADRISRKVARE